MFWRLSGIAARMPVASFAINYGPPLVPGDGFAKFVRESYASILWGVGCKQGLVFIVLFAFASVCHCGSCSRLADAWMTFSAPALTMVSLIEITLYISALYPPQTMTAISFEMIYSVQHLYFIVAAPALFIPLGLVLLRVRVLPRAFTLLALLLGIGFGIVGMASSLIDAARIRHRARRHSGNLVVCSRTFTLIIRSRHVTSTLAQGMHWIT